jgi:ABC-type nickel/cobalt efflux system permease component RcnA
MTAEASKRRGEEAFQLVLAMLVTCALFFASMPVTHLNHAGEGHEHTDARDHGSSHGHHHDHTHSDDAVDEGIVSSDHPLLAAGDAGLDRPMHQHLGMQEHTPAILPLGGFSLRVWAKIAGWPVGLKARRWTDALVEVARPPWRQDHG